MTANCLSALLGWAGKVTSESTATEGRHNLRRPLALALSGGCSLINARSAIDKLRTR
jgi:hypothetical protein